MIGHPKEYVVYSLLQFSHNAPCLPPPPSTKKNSISIVFNFSWDNCNSQEKWEQKFSKTFGGEWGGGPQMANG